MFSLKDEVGALANALRLFEVRLLLVDCDSTLTPTFYEEAFRTLKPSLVQIADIGVVRFVGEVNDIFHVVHTQFLYLEAN